jgi:hypothetical protein
MAKNSFLISRKTGQILHAYPLHIPDLLYAEIKRAAQARGVTVAHVIRTALAIGLPRLGTDLPVTAPNTTNGKGGSDDGEQNQLRQLVR